MTEEELLMGDDAIHGEAAYAFENSDEISGVVPSAGVLEGHRLRADDLEGGGSHSGSQSSDHKRPNMEMKVD